MPTPAEEAEKRGLRSRDRGQASGAILNFQTAVDLSDPNRRDGARARRAMLLGEAHAISGNLDIATTWYAETLNDSTEALVLLNTWRLTSALLLSHGRIADSRAAIEEAWVLAPDSSADGIESLDLLLQTALVNEAEGKLTDLELTKLAELEHAYGARPDRQGARGKGHCQLLRARIAVSHEDHELAARIADSVVAAASGDPAMIRLRAGALLVSGEAQLAAARFDSAIQSFEACAACSGGPELGTWLTQARLGLAAAYRATGALRAGHRELERIAKTIDVDKETRPLQAKYFLARGLSHLSLSLDAAPEMRRTELGLARSALRTAEHARAGIDHSERLAVQISTALGFAQRALGRPRQSVQTLEEARQFIDSPGTVTADRGDFLSSLASSQLREAADPDALNKAAASYQEARAAYTSWYDLARTDQNLAMIDKRRADLAITRGDRREESRHLTAVVDRLVPALLAKFAVRYTLSSQRMRQQWNDQQAHGLAVALDSAVRLSEPTPDPAASHSATAATQLILDLVLCSRLHGVLEPSLPDDQSAVFDERGHERVGTFAANPTGTGASPSVAELLGFGDEPGRLAPAPRLLAPDGRIVLADYFALAVERYCGPHGLDPQHLYRQGHMMKL